MPNCEKHPDTPLVCFCPKCRGQAKSEAPVSLGTNAASALANAGVGKASLPTPLGQIGAFLSGNAQAFNNVAGGI